MHVQNARTNIQMNPDSVSLVIPSCKHGLAALQQLYNPLSVTTTMLLLLPCPARSVPPPSAAPPVSPPRPLRCPSPQARSQFAVFATVHVL